MSYIFDANTDPNERTRRRKLAEALMLKATDAGPIASPWQGAAKMAQALLGGIELGQYDKQDRLGRESAKADMEAAMGGGGVTAQPQGPSPNPVAAALGSGAPVGGFSNAVSRTLQFEGGLNPSDTNGTPTNFGINQAANPDVDVKGLTKDTATALYKARYWDTIGGDKIAAQNPALAHVAFDTSVLAGPGKAKALLAASGGDPQKFLQLREQFQNSLLQRDPAKYGQYAKAWGNRTAGLKADIGYTAPQGSAVATVLAGGGGQPTMAGGDTLAQPTQLPSAAPATGLMGAGQDTSSQQASILKALQNPYISPAQKQVLTLRYQSLQKEAPTYGFQTVGNQVYRTNPKTGAMEPVMQVPQDPTEARLKKAQADKAERDLQQGNPDLEIIKDRNGNPIASFNKRTGERKPFTDLPAPDEMFNGNGEGAQALNFLVKQGRLTKEQAAMMAAGKFTTQADGSLLFVTPDAIFPNATAAPKQPTEPPPPGATVPQTTKPGTETQGVRTITAPRPDKPLTESESKIFQFTRRADAAAKTLQGLETEGTRSISRFFDTKVPGGNYLVGEDFQKFAQAKREFINALLRRESGAVIGKEEEDNFDKQYMPMPGDAKSVIEQKRVARMRAIQAMKEELGGKYKEPGPGEETAAPTNDPAALKKKYGLD